MKGPIEFMRNHATPDNVAAHLKECDSGFNPPLSERVDIVAYAEKIHANAERFEAWIDNRLIGMVAAYVNLPDRSGFITNVSVVGDARGKGIASTLCSQYLRYAQEQNLKSVALEVGKDNTAAIRLYEKLGFTMHSTYGLTLRLQLNLTTGTRP
jgi:ribosomal protein S18 acetylase RimI-like enzyme